MFLVAGNANRIKIGPVRARCHNRKKQVAARAIAGANRGAGMRRAGLRTARIGLCCAFVGLQNEASGNGKDRKQTMVSEGAEGLFGFFRRDG